MEGRGKKTLAELTLMTVEEYRRREKVPLMVVADSVRSLHNVGALFRTADAFGLHSVLLCGISGTPPHPELHKSALGAENSVEWSHEADALEAVRKLRAQGWRVCVLEQAHGSVPLQDFRARQGEKYALVVGNEVEGVDQRIVDLADHLLEIPQRGTKHSLNVSVSAGMALFHIYSQLAGQGL